MNVAMKEILDDQAKNKFSAGTCRVPLIYGESCISLSDVSI